MFPLYICVLSDNLVKSFHAQVHLKCTFLAMIFLSKSSTSIKHRTAINDIFIDLFLFSFLLINNHFFFSPYWKKYCDWDTAKTYTWYSDLITKWNKPSKLCLPVYLKQNYNQTKLFLCVIFLKTNFNKIKKDDSSIQESPVYITLPLQDDGLFSLFL